MSRSARKPSRKRQHCLLPAANAVDVLFATLGGSDLRQLMALWDNWAFAVGVDVAELGLPLGHNDATLLIGVEDSMALQELSMQTPEILERVNAFMDAPFFRQVRLVLRQEQRSLTEKKPRRAARFVPQIMPPAPPRLGSLLGRLNPDSPITRCYEAYVRAFFGDGISLK